MAIPDEIRQYLDSQVEYYTSEARSYSEIMEGYLPEVDSVHDSTFGMIIGCIYSAFLQAYQTQGKSLPLEDVQQFNQIMRESAPLIKKAIINGLAGDSVGQTEQTKGVGDP